MSDRDAVAYWVDGPRRGALRSEVLPSPGANEAVVRALHGAISRGTELLVYRGQVPPSEHQRMRAPFQDGEFSFPVKYGYATVGVVERGPDGWAGRTVFCLHPHQTRFVVPVDALHPVPAGVPPARAVLAANLETAINASWDLAPRVGDRIAIVGAGTVGLLCAWLCARIPGCQVQVIDLNPAREPVVRALGATFALPPAAAGDADRVIHASGTGEGLDTALSLAAFEATILELSWYGERPVTVSLGAGFHARRLTLASSQVGSIAASQRARWNHRRRMTLALSLLVDPVLDRLITGAHGFDDLPQRMRLLDQGVSECICERVDYPARET